jgi:GGDEF domain-containing protein
MLISLLLGLDGVVQSAVPSWTQLGLGFFALIPVVLAGIWLGRVAAIAAALAAATLATTSIAGAADSPSTAMLVLGAVFRVLGYAGIGLVVAESTARLRRLATTDPLTGLANRRAFFECAPGFAAPGAQVTVIACDVNGLKQINDRSGHDQGDRAIVETGRALRALAGGSALVARVGGDEFLALTTRAERALRAADARPAGATLGFARWRAGEPLDHALRQADMDLYAGKFEHHGAPIVRRSGRRAEPAAA